MSNNSKWGKVAASRTTTGADVGASSSAAPGERRPVTGLGGTMIMKSVSIFLTNGRRASKQGLQSRSRLRTGSRGANMTSDNTQNGGGACAGGGGAGGAAAGVATEAPRRRRRSNAVEGKINPKLLEAYKKKTHFSKDEVLALVRIYRKLVSNCKVTSRAAAAGSSVIAKPHSTVEGIDRSVFRELLHTTFDIVTEETLMERIFCAWEKGFEGLPIRLDGWIMGLSVFLRGSQEEKMGYCFRVYDLNTDGFITKDEMFALLRNCLIKQPQDEDPDEGVKDLVEIALKKFDIDKDGKVNFADFQNAVNDEPLLLEAFGQCLPSESATVSFLSTLQA